MKLLTTLVFVLFAFSSIFSQVQRINIESPFFTDFLVTSPSSIASKHVYRAQTGSDTNPIWGPIIDTDIAGEIVWAFNDTDSLACLNPDGSGNITTDLTGKVALIHRGGCSFVEKVLNAQYAGASAVVIVNHFSNSNENDFSLIALGGDDGTMSSLVTVPAIFISRNSGYSIIPEIDAG